MSLAKRFKFGENRGRVGNSRIKKAIKNFHKRKRGKNSAKSIAGGYHNHLLTSLMAEAINEESKSPEYKIVLKKKPLKGKILSAMVIDKFKVINTEPGKSMLAWLEKEESVEANIQHIDSELTQIDQDIKSGVRTGIDTWKIVVAQEKGEEYLISREEREEKEKELFKKLTETKKEVIDAYNLQRESEVESLYKIMKITKHFHQNKREGGRFYTKTLRLRVVDSIFSKELEGYECICVPVELSRSFPTKQTRIKFFRNGLTAMAYKVPSDEIELEEYEEYFQRR